MESKIKQNSDQVGNSLREGARNLTENLNGLRGEVSSLGNDLQKVKESITQVRTQVESQLEQFLTEWDGRLEGRLTEVSSNVNNKVDEVSRNVNNKVDEVNARMNEMRDQVEALKSIAQNTEIQNVRRVNDLEKELEGVQNRIMVTIEQMSEKTNNTSSMASETAPSGYVVNTGASAPVAQPSSSTPEHTQHLSLDPPDQNVHYGESETNSNMRINAGESHNIHSVRQTPVFGSEISLPHFGNKIGQNPVVYLNALEDYFDLKGTPDSQKMMLVKNSLTGSALGWYQIFLSRDISYDLFRQMFLEFYWDHSKQALLRKRINHGKFEQKSKHDMADYLIELAQLSRLLNPPLKDDEFLSLAIQHFPQEVRSALIVAKPTDFGEAVSLLKKLQCRKLNKRNGEVNLGIYHPGRKNAQGSEGHSVVGREAGASQTVGTSPEAYGEPANRSWRDSGHEWENRAGPSGEG